MKEKKNQFSGQIGFVLAAAGSAVGVGNLWRFPYLAAKDGGGLFLIVYLALVLTFGFTLLSSDIAIGRKTQKSAIGAYEEMQPKWKFLGILTFLVPVLIMTYYVVIGGWITKYAVVYFSGQANAAAQDNYFTSFITSPVSPVVFALFSSISQLCCKRCRIHLRHLCHIGVVDLQLTEICAHGEIIGHLGISNGAVNIVGEQLLCFNLRIGGADHLGNADIGPCVCKHAAA